MRHRTRRCHHGWCKTDIKKGSRLFHRQAARLHFGAAESALSDAGIFQLMTHAFSKALLFWAAGSVIHAMGGEQDYAPIWRSQPKKSNSLRDHAIATLGHRRARSLAGFFSKDAFCSVLHIGGQMVDMSFTTSCSQLC